MTDDSIAHPRTKRTIRQEAAFLAREIQEDVMAREGELARAIETAMIRSLSDTELARRARQAFVDYADELDKAACDRCEQCGPMVMCPFHSLLSLLVAGTGLPTRPDHD